MSQVRDLLIEIGTEELPPKALKTLSKSFKEHFSQGLEKQNLGCKTITAYATPRRLALLVRELNEFQPDREIERRGPAVQSAFDEDGRPTKAAEGFARSCGVKVEDLETLSNDKGAWLVFRATERGRHCREFIPSLVEQALEKLPIPKRMRWGSRNEEFVRPVHWVVLLLGNEIIEASVLGVKAGGESYGHRFHHPTAIALRDPSQYENQLFEAEVVVNVKRRRKAICQQVEQAAEELGGRAHINDSLLDEVTALVEWPVAVVGQFEDRYLEVPAEALITTMQDNQKYFPVMDCGGQLLPYFITISNIQSRDPQQVKIGNERVIRPRLADAAFFWEQDRKHPLESRMAVLDNVVFQEKLGSIGDKSRRVAHVAKQVAKMLGSDGDLAHRAALLSKCDLMTEMVGEFPSLQGIMGRYYAQHDNESPEVARALDEQYMPRHAGDELPISVTGQILALCDKLDTLLGIFAIGQKPSGEKDPFALRRAALGVLRILIERDLALDLKELLGIAAEILETKVKAKAVVDEVFEFVMERLHAYYAERGITPDVFDAVASRKPTQPTDFDRRIEAVNIFHKLPEAASLAAANKRIANILRQATEAGESNNIDTQLLTEEAEKRLYEHLQELTDDVQPLFDQGDYTTALRKLAVLREPVDTFFDHVMVMAENENIRSNRIALLSRMRALFLRAADFSRLQS